MGNDVSRRHLDFARWAVYALCADRGREVLRYGRICVRDGVRQAQDVPDDLAEEVMGRAAWLDALLGGDGGGAVLALVATACDLIESRFKREFDVKDSSCFLPAGMGGLLDMFDSVLFIPALAYPFLVTFSV